MTCEQGGVGRRDHDACYCFGAMGGVRGADGGEDGGIGLDGHWPDMCCHKGLLLYSIAES